MSVRRTQNRKLLLVFDVQRHHHVMVAGGIANELKTSTSWATRFMRPSHTSMYASAVRTWRPAAILAAADGIRDHPLPPFGCPVVAVGCRHDVPCDAQVHYDDEEAGRLAAREILHYPIASAALAEHPSHPGARARNRGFRRVMKAAGIPVRQTKLLEEAFEPSDVWRTKSQDLMEWLLALPRPCGMFGWADGLSSFLMEACRQAGLHIPNDVLITSADNRTEVCETTNPPLTSVVIPFRAAGAEAARLLTRLLRGQAPSDSLRVPITEIVVRDSTQWRGLDDELVLAALDVINRGGAIAGIDPLCTELKVPRRSLERRFRSAMGYTLLEAIQRHRVKRAIALLRSGTLSVTGVAAECGFRSVRSLEGLLKKRTGKLPREFRGHPFSGPR